MKILIVHNHYGDHAVGGESRVVAEESALLRHMGHEVLNYERSNSELREGTLFRRLWRFTQLQWSPDATREIGEVLDRFRPDVMHVHNYKFLLTPSIFEAARERGVRTVLTLHNYRLLVPCGNYMNRRNEVCERCDDGCCGRYWYSFCTRGNPVKRWMQYQSFLGGLQKHHLSGVVDCFVALSEFARRKLLLRGVPERQILVKPNFMADPCPGFRADETAKREGGIFIGRLSPEKGAVTLLESWKNRTEPLLIVGDGPERRRLQKRFPDPAIRWLGAMPHQEVQKLLRHSRFLLFPSAWFEGFPLSLLEAKANGVPVIATDLGPRRELVRDGVDGLLYDHRTPDTLSAAVERLEKMSTPAYRTMCEAARNDYLTRYTPERNYPLLMRAYRVECQRNKEKSP